VIGPEGRRIVARAYSTIRSITVIELHEIIGSRHVIGNGDRDIEFVDSECRNS
jgi:hypothetical protein